MSQQMLEMFRQHDLPSVYRWLLHKQSESIELNKPNEPNMFTECVPLVLLLRFAAMPDLSSELPNLSTR